MKRNFMQLLKARQDAGYHVCVGLDPVLDKIPKHIKAQLVWWDRIVQFCCQIVDSTKDIVCAYKPNSAFFEAHGEDGFRALKTIIGHIRMTTSGVPIIYDAKRGDIGNTNDGYVKGAFDILGADAITVHPYMGKKSLQPFLDQKDKGIFVLCRTSNPESDEFQRLPVKLDIGDRCALGLGHEAVLPLYQYVAYKVSRKWNGNGNCCLVVGATYPGELEIVRRMIGPEMQILIPGVGAQGGDLEASAKASGPSSLFNLSRSVLYASSGEDFAEAARKEVMSKNRAIQACL